MIQEHLSASLQIYRHVGGLDNKCSGDIFSLSSDIVKQEDNIKSMKEELAKMK